MNNTVFLTNLDRLRHRTVTVPYPHRHRTVPLPSPYRTPPYPPFLSFLRLKSVKNGGYGGGTVRYGDANGLNSLETLYFHLLPRAYP